MFNWMINQVNFLPETCYDPFETVSLVRTYVPKEPRSSDKKFEPEKKELTSIMSRL